MEKQLKNTKIIFTVYSVLILWVVLFKCAFSFAEIPWFGEIKSVNLIPFYREGDASRLDIRETLLNILLFVPLGLYLRMLDMPGRKSILCGCAFSFVLELCQFALAIGVCDITDLITNTLGTTVGVCIYWLAVKTLGNRQRTIRVINGFAAVVLLIFLSLTLLLMRSNLVVSCHILCS